MNAKRRVVGWLLTGQLAVILLLALLVALTACVDLPPATATPGPQPLLRGSRSLSAPVTPVISAALSYVTNIACSGDCSLGGGASVVTGDFVVGWTHADPLTVDYYEVWREADANTSREVYFDPATCVSCTLALTTTGLAATITDSPAGWNPIHGTAGSTLASDLDLYVVRACNAAGCSGRSERIGVMSYSLAQGAEELPGW